MSVWYEGSRDIACDMEAVRRSVANPGEYFTGVVRRMPGMTTVELVESGADHVTLRTNEGVMRRTQIATRDEGDLVVIEFDEEYQAGTKVTTHSHFREQFRPSETGVTYTTEVSGVKASGVLGFLYRTFGSSNMGKAFLEAQAAYFEQR